MVLVMKSVSGPTLVDGSFNLSFRPYEKVIDAVVSIDQSMNTTGDASGQIDISFNYATTDGSTNYVVVYGTYKSLNATGGGRTAATTAMLNGKKCVVIADCE